MNLSTSLGIGVGCGDMRVEQVASPAPRLPRQRTRDDSSHLELLLRFAWWAHQLHRFPSMEQVRDHFDVSRATAYRWRSALAAAHGIAVPTEEREESDAD